MSKEDGHGYEAVSGDIKLRGRIHVHLSNSFPDRPFASHLEDSWYALTCVRISTSRANTLHNLSREVDGVNEKWMEKFHTAGPYGSGLIAFTGQYLGKQWACASMHFVDGAPIFGLPTFLLHEVCSSSTGRGACARRANVAFVLASSSERTLGPRSVEVSSWTSCR